MPSFNFSFFPVLITGRLLLRQLATEDQHEIFALRSNDLVNEFIDRPKATSVEDARNFIEYINQSIHNNKSLYWAITFKNDPKLIGTICLWNLSEEEAKAETGFELLPNHHGKGIMQEALASVIDFGFETMKLKTIEAWTNPLNKPSIKLLEKNNFRRDMNEEKKKKETLNSHIIYSLGSKTIA